MQDLKQNLSRRDFVRGLSATALAAGAGSWLAGCGGGGNSGGPATPAPGATQQPGAPQQPSARYTMFISTFLARGVLKYDSGTGKVSQLAKFDRLAPNVTDTAKEQTTAGLVLSPNKQNLFVFSPGSDQILMLDPNTGAIKRRITGPHVNTTHDGAIGPDGKLYYVNAPSLVAFTGPSQRDSIEVLDPNSGDHIGTFIDSDSQPQVRGPFGLKWGPDGDLYMSSTLSFGFNPNTFPFRPDKVAHFDGKSGAFKGFAVRDAHLSFTLEFHRTNGQLLLPSFFFNRVYNYDAATAKQIDAFVDVQFPTQVLYGPDGDLFVTSFSDQKHLDLLTDRPADNDQNAQGAGRVLRYDGVTGKLKAVVASGLPYAGFLAFG